MRAWKRSAVLTLILLAVGLVPWLGAPSGPADGPPVPGADGAAGGPSTPFALVGTASCSARGCHGRFEPAPGQADAPVLLDEYTRWTRQDKHADA